MTTIQASYDLWAVQYDNEVNRTRDLDHACLREWLIDRCFETVLETGCGTGKNTALLAAHAAQVKAVDFSANMLEIAQAKIADARVEFGVVDLLQPWPIASASIDLIACDLVLEHIDALSHYFAEAARVLRPNGLLRISELHPFRQWQGKQARFVVADGSTHRVTAFTHAISDYFRSAQANGFRLIECEERHHLDDEGNPPRLLNLVWVKDAS